MAQKFIDFLCTQRAQPRCRSIIDLQFFLFCFSILQLPIMPKSSGNSNPNASVDMFIITVVVSPFAPSLLSPSGRPPYFSEQERDPNNTTRCFLPSPSFLPGRAVKERGNDAGKAVGACTSDVCSCAAKVTA
ncbi:hypothetical protein LXL04_022268 [Taraxacum kok-saghyz]